MSKETKPNFTYIFSLTRVVCQQDTGYCVSVYLLSNTPAPVLLGQYIAHSKPIQDIFFTLNSKDKTLKLFTLGADRNIAEFNIVFE